jgi:hypothetical protein
MSAMNARNWRSVFALFAFAAVWLIFALAMHFAGRW